MDFRAFLKNHKVIADGGMGTMLRLLCPEEEGMLSELFNETHPDVVTEVHRRYFAAGSDYVVTNTFGANILKYDEERLRKIVKAAVLNARKAAEISGCDRPKFVALDVGPLGRLIEPFGDCPFEEAVKAFRTLCGIGDECGVDFIVIETFTDLYETKAAVLGAKEACNLPIVVTNAYSENGKLLTGASPENVILTLEAMGVSAIGINCSFGPEESLPIIEKYLEHAHVPVVFKPNAGLPDQNGNYHLKPSEFAEIVLKTAKNGISVVGGCCGTTPEFISALRERIENKNCAFECANSKGWEVCSALKKADAGKGFLVIGERLNPTGKKRLKEALYSRDFDYVVSEGEKQAREGADVIDVNVGLPGIDEPEMLASVIKELQKTVDLPICIDTTEPEALECALRAYNGKALINSVNGKRESMDTVFPLAKKYGGNVVCLLLDENGIPENAEGRLKIAEKITERAAAYGLGRDELIFDPLCLSIATDRTAALTTLECVKELCARGFRTVLGVSNVSYGLPERPLVTATFLQLARENGLSAAIVNPSMENRTDEFARNALLGLDENCARYIEHAKPAENVKTPAEAVRESSESPAETLKTAVRKGRKATAAKAVAELLKTSDSLDIINECIIPALDAVGADYEKNVIFLPQLLTSAEAAGAAFDTIKSASENDGGGPRKAKFVLATVKGDIHDIGKNIVKMLLQNYGYDVLDLGKDVPPETVLNELKNSGARLLGLSALMTTTLRSMKETVALVKRELPEVKICVGGAVLTREYAEEIGADKYAKDAMETVTWAEALISEVKA